MMVMIMMHEFMQFSLLLFISFGQGFWKFFLLYFLVSVDIHFYVYLASVHTYEV